MAAGKSRGEGGQGELHGLAETLEGPFWCCGEWQDRVADKGGRVFLPVRDMERRGDAAATPLLRDEKRGVALDNPPR